MSFEFVIRNGTVVTSTESLRADIAVEGGRIVEIAERLRGDTEIDAGGKLVMPGGVDPHCHIEQLSGMGQPNADTFETATRSAAMGGTTSVISFAAQHGGQRLCDVVENYARCARRGAMVDHAFHMTISDTSVPNFESDLMALMAEGHRSIKVFTTYNIALGDADILRVMTLALQGGALVCVHAENDAMIQTAKAGLLAAGLTRPEHHAASHPRMAEIEAVARMCRFAEFTGQPVMLFHISTSEGAEIVRKARSRGAPVWAETCPHYLLMTYDVLKRDGLEGAKWMCSPPQRQSADQDALWQALSNTDLQIISSDHAPYRYDETGKLSAGPTATFAEIANGLPGLETRLPLLFDAMVSRDGKSLQDFVRLTSTNAANLYGLASKGDLAVGKDADIVIWDAEKSVTYGDNDLHDNVGYNPWSGRKVTGWPEQVFLRGECIAKNGAFLGTPGSGTWLDRRRPGVTPTVPAAELQLIEEANT